VATEQYESTSQSVKDFALLQHVECAIRHAFFADMGGFVLQSPDFPPFPVDSQQMLYLVREGYISFPDVDKETIRALPPSAYAAVDWTFSIPHV
jgi:hypothetical protein